MPPELKSKKGWKGMYRRVRKDAVHRGFVIDMTTYDKTVKLYHEADTVPYKPTTRTLAMRAFHAWLVRPTSTGQHLRWLDDKGGWRDCYGKMTLEDTKRHINGREMLGVFGGDRTHFRAIDLDLTWDGSEKFFKRFRVLQSYFHGRDGWHYQSRGSGRRGRSSASRSSRSRPTSTLPSTNSRRPWQNWTGSIPAWAWPGWRSTRSRTTASGCRYAGDARCSPTARPGTWWSTWPGSCTPSSTWPRKRSSITCGSD